MTIDRFFLDTSFLQAVLNRKDQDHARAQALLPRVRVAKLVISTEAVLIEVGNAFGKIDRRKGAKTIEEYLEASRDPASNVEIVPVDTELLREGLAIYRRAADKQWGLTDCISFAVMRKRGVRDALTADRHFPQCGFRALLREEG